MNFCLSLSILLLTALPPTGHSAEEDSGADQILSFYNEAQYATSLAEIAVGTVGLGLSLRHVNIAALSTTPITAAEREILHQRATTAVRASLPPEYHELELRLRAMGKLTSLNGVPFLLLESEDERLLRDLARMKEFNEEAVVRTRPELARLLAESEQQNRVTQIARQRSASRLRIFALLGSVVLLTDGSSRLFILSHVGDPGIIASYNFTREFFRQAAQVAPLDTAQR